MIVSVLALAVLVLLAIVVAGGFLLRVVGRIAVLAGLAGAVVDGDLIGLFVALIGCLMVLAGSSRRLDRRRRHV
ncbi:MAG: hypothetical protein JSU06_00460 [Actinobacteria bacterium]|nr:hypothetical protein [Actinomycetota bacterium]